MDVMDDIYFESWLTMDDFWTPNRINAFLKKSDCNFRMQNFLGKVSKEGIVFGSGDFLSSGHLCNYTLFCRKSKPINSKP